MITMWQDFISSHKHFEIKCRWFLLTADEILMCCLQKKKVTLGIVSNKYFEFLRTWLRWNFMMGLVWVSEQYFAVYIEEEFVYCFEVSAGQ